jgi:hypothetical protein
MYLPDLFLIGEFGLVAAKWKIATLVALVSAWARAKYENNNNKNPLQLHGGDEKL